ncbi:MAG TPA: hypothetical protein VF552_05350 [Allosphingosinicella sp.]|jgi:hypothetical protein
MTGWSQLTAAIEAMSANPATLAQLQERCASLYAVQFGTPRTLMAALAANPSVLHGPVPPADVYGHFAWLAVRTYAAVRTIESTLGQLPDLLATPAESHERLGGAAAEALAGGAIAPCNAVVSDTEALLRRLGTLDGAVDAAVEDFRAAGAELAERASAAGSSNTNNLAFLAGAAGDAVGSLRQSLDELELAAQTVSAAAVVGNLATALEKIAATWREAGDRFAAVTDRASPAQLGDIGFLRDTCGLDRAVADWSEFAKMVRMFMKRLLAGAS